MKFILSTLIALMVGVGIWYFISNKQDGMQQQIDTMQQGAQDQADAYRQQQAEMMKQLEQ